MHNSQIQKVELGLKERDKRIQELELEVKEGRGDAETELWKKFTVVEKRLKKKSLGVE